MRHYYFLFAFLLLLTAFFPGKITAQSKSIFQKVDSVLRHMTLEEKVGQLNQY
jgi:beta-glucosidase